MAFFRIGKLSQLTNIPVKTLRFYDEIGILPPAQVDRFTGYRYYNQESVQKITAIQALKSMGFSLAEIKNYSSQDISRKTAELQQQLNQLNNSLTLLKKLEDHKGDLTMITKQNKFINDENAIGKWVNQNETQAEKTFKIKELYLLPNGQPYWAVSWTKGFITLGQNTCRYEINGDILHLHFTKSEEEFVITYKRENNKKYTKCEIPLKTDDINVPFTQDKKVLGTWICTDYVNEIRYFNSNERSFKDPLLYKSFTFKKDGVVLSECEDGSVYNHLKWTKGFVLHAGDFTKSAIKIKKINEKTYLFMEHKSGDYVWGGFISGYYVFVKE